jgi:hypothetical protein
MWRSSGVVAGGLHLRINAVALDDLSRNQWTNWARSDVTHAVANAVHEGSLPSLMNEMHAPLGNLLLRSIQLTEATIVVFVGAP